MPDEGEVKLDGSPVPHGDPRVALEAGIACIYQESNLVPTLTVLDNVMLGSQPVKSWGRLDRETQRRIVGDLLAQHEIDLGLDVEVRTLPTVQQKQVEIAKALARDARVILMDEPTAWLSQVEVQSLFASIRRLTEQGIGVVYISHVLDEVFTIADNVSVVRDGKVILTSSVKALTKASLAQAMLGRELLAETQAEREVQREVDNPIALECRALTVPGAFHEVDLVVRKGEIVCVTGLIGAGRSELFKALFGVDPARSGEILVHGNPMRVTRPDQAIKAGLGLVPEDRREDGLMMNHSVRNNVIAAHLGRHQQGRRAQRPSGQIARRRRRAAARHRAAKAGPRRTQAQRRQPAEGADGAVDGGGDATSCCSTSRPSASTSAPRPRSTSA